MLRPRFLTILLLIICGVQLATAQNQSVRGVVVNQRDLQELSKVEVCINGDYHCLELLNLSGH